MDKLNDIQAVIFDMDGVIFDSENLVMECWDIVAKKYGIKNVRKNLIKCIGTTRDVTRDIMKTAYGADFQYDEYKAECSAIFHENAKNGKLAKKPGVFEILNFLKDNGYKIALASSTRREIVIRELDEGGLISYFDKIICGDMVEKSKPAPDIFLKACEELSVNPKNAIAVEDSYNGIRSAYAGGLHPVMIPDLLPANDEMQKKAELIFDNLLEFMNYMKKYQ